MNFIQCGDHAIHYSYLDNHKEQTFLFINSLGTDFRIWDEVVKDLKEYGNILLYDKRGHGLSDVAKPEDRLNDYAEDAWFLLQNFSIDNCIVIGISVGGMIAQILAHQHPAHIRKLILCDTAHIIGNEKMWNERIAQIRSNGLKAITDTLMKRWLSPSFHEKYPERVAGYKNMVERCDEEGYIQTSESLRDMDITGISKNLKIPALCIVGSEDLSITPEEVKAMSQLINGSKFEMIQNSCHMTCIDNAEIFASLVIDFIK
jgi:3-oxoadipate enol-lactonase